MTKKGYEVLNFLVNNGFTNHIAAVISSNDRNVVKDYYDEIKVLCTKAGIKFANRTENIGNINCELSVAISWRWLINENELIVFHDSILPKYRGFSPLVNMLINGEQNIGVTALFANEEYDKGDIISQSVQKIKYPITIEKAIEQITKNYIELASHIFQAVSKNEKIVGKKQLDENASYSLWRDEKDYFIDWTGDSAGIKRFVDAVGFPFKGASTTCDGKSIKILSVIEQHDVTIENRLPGKVIFLKQGKPVVVCGSGLILIGEMRLAESNELFQIKKFRTRFQ
ncbi:MAG: hypothetical protein LH478_05610 [Chitinophagaceae bacterium]|nr:hypothetical protein [Chitinophagaceae bacterium]